MHAIDRELEARGEAAGPLVFNPVRPPPPPFLPLSTRHLHGEASRLAARTVLLLVS